MWKTLTLTAALALMPGIAVAKPLTPHTLLGDTPVCDSIASLGVLIQHMGDARSFATALQAMDAADRCATVPKGTRFVIERRIGGFVCIRPPAHGPCNWTVLPKDDLASR